MYMTIIYYKIHFYITILFCIKDSQAHPKEVDPVLTASGGFL